MSLDLSNDPSPMQYSMLIYLDQARFYALSKDEQNRIHRECGAWHDDLVRRGISRGALGLQPVATATTLRAAPGRVLITDGPFAETKEVLGGLEILECRDLDEAVAVASRFPGLQVGSAVELRPMVEGGQCVAE